MVSAKKLNIILFGGGIFCFVFGVSMGVAWPYIFDLIFKQMMQFQPSSETYKLWKDEPVPIYMNLYVFNWTNYKEFEQDQTLTPHFEEVGPFVFEEKHDRVDIVWDDDNYLVSFNETRTWHFVPEQSLDLSTNVTNINPLALSIAYMARHWSSQLWTEVVNTLLNEHEDFFTTAPASEWLFDGFEDYFTHALDGLRNLTYIEIPYDKFSWFPDRNQSSTYDGRFTMKTGVDNIYKLGLMERWNNMNETWYYRDKCSIVEGSTGEVIPPVKDVQNYSRVWSSDICSYVDLYYEGETSVEGVDGVEYIGDERMLDNGTYNFDNACFCSGECMPNGVRNVSLCRFKTPAFVSLPHFYAADPIYTENVGGMNASEEKHKFRFRFQPDIGIPLEVRAALQANLLLQPLPQFDLYKNSPRVLIPMMWFTQTAKITPDLAWLINLLLIVPDLGMGIFYAIGGIGYLMILGRFIYIIRQHQKNTSMKLEGSSE